MDYHCRSALVVVLVSTATILNSSASDSSLKSQVAVRVISPRTGAELLPGGDKVTLVVEVEDATEHGLKLNKGIPVFETPEDKKGVVKQSAKDNLDLFLKSLIGVTTYKVTKVPGGEKATVYQLTSVMKTGLPFGV
jgi:hypothetical protein